MLHTPDSSTFQDRCPQGGVPSPSDVRGQLERILASKAFNQSVRMSRFLRFVVESALEDRNAELKETTVAVAVFDRDASYSPKEDPVVRNEARRLRSKLDQYYETEGMHDPIRIEVPKGGYVPRFEGLAQPLSLPTPAPAETAVPAKLPERPTTRLWWMAGLILLVSTALAGLVFSNIHRSRQEATSGERAHLQPLTSYPGQECEPAIAPDGKRIAFSWDGGNANFDIYTKTISGPAVRLTSNPAHDLYPAWSPDGNRIAFVRISKTGAALMLSAATAGGESELRKLQALAWRPDPTQGQSIGPVWSPDGRYLVVSDWPTGEPGRPLYAETVATGESRRLTNPRTGEEDYYPRYSPDGKWIAFVRVFTNSSADVFMVPSAGGEPKRVTNEAHDVRGLSWMPDGRRLVISSNRSGAYGLWIVPVSGAEPVAIPASGTNATEPAVAPDGSWLAYRDSSLNANVWRVPIGNQSGTRKAGRLIFSSRQNHSAEYSPDGGRIAFVSNRSGNWEIWTAKADASEPLQLTHFDGPMVGTPHWSPDGRLIAFDARPEGHSAIFIVPAAGGAPRQPERNTFEEKMPSWSHDGQWIYMSSNRENSVGLWKIPVNGGAPVSVSRHSAYDQAESSDGKTLYFLDADLHIWQVPTDAAMGGGTATPVAGLEKMNTGRIWAVAPDGIFFANQTDPAAGIQFYRFATHDIERKETGAGRFLFGTPSLSRSPDGRWLLYASPDDTQSDLMMLRGSW